MWMVLSHSIDFNLRVLPSSLRKISVSFAVQTVFKIWSEHQMQQQQISTLVLLLVHHFSQSITTETIWTQLEYWLMECPMCMTVQVCHNVRKHTVMGFWRLNRPTLAAFQTKKKSFKGKNRFRNGVERQMWCCIEKACDRKRMEAMSLQRKCTRYLAGKRKMMEEC